MADLAQQILQTQLQQQGQALGIAMAPFASNGRAFYNNQPYLGGTILVVSVPFNVNTQLTIPHGLRAIPRELQIKYKTQWTDWKAWKAWDATNIYVQFSTTFISSDKLIIFVA